jgi:hypothetical protein
MITSFDEVKPERFWARVQRGDGCWLWTGARRSNGYGTYSVGRGRTTTAHRVAFVLSGGTIPDGYQVDHLCKNPQCVRPDHLEAVTPKENNRRSESPTARNARKVECVNGHPLTPENVQLVAKGRHCRLCRNENNRAIRAAKRAEVARINALKADAADDGELPLDPA